MYASESTEKTDMYLKELAKILKENDYLGVKYDGWLQYVSVNNDIFVYGIGLNSSSVGRSYRNVRYLVDDIGVMQEKRKINKDTDLKIQYFRTLIPIYTSYISKCDVLKVIEKELRGAE